MNQHRLVVKQSSVTDLWRLGDTGWQSSHSHKPVARLTMVVAWSQARRTMRRSGAGSEAINFFSLAAAIGFFALAMFLGGGYLSDVLLIKTQSLQFYNQPQAQYSDVWRWQKH